MDVGVGAAAEEGGEEEVVSPGGGVGGGVAGGAHALVDIDGLGEHAGLGIEIYNGVEEGLGEGEGGKGEGKRSDGVHLAVEASGAKLLDGDEKGGEMVVVVVCGASAGGTAEAGMAEGGEEEFVAKAGVWVAGEGGGEVGGGEAQGELGDSTVELGLVYGRRGSLGSFTSGGSSGSDRGEGEGGK